VTAALVVRPAVVGDRAKLRQAVIELQEHERRLHATRLPAALMVDAYLDWMLARAERDGAVLVAEQGGVFAGFVDGWIEQTDAIAETADSNRFGYVSDICVMPVYRGQRIARRLLTEIEDCVRRHGVVRVRINALAANDPARRSYERSGFVPCEIQYERYRDIRNERRRGGLCSATGRVCRIVRCRRAAAAADGAGSGDKEAT
jgi:ribosomal protein S18 acetylase RimI-like enzyme